MSFVPSARHYVLITAAHNEEAFIENTILSVVAQTLLPKRWVIVDDGSTDCTSDLVRTLARQHKFIELLQLHRNHSPDFCSQVHAINAGYELLKPGNYDFIGNLDADISFEPFYYSELIRQFEADNCLGLAGGLMYEAQNGTFKPRTGNRRGSVPHGIQFFRWKCFDGMGGYPPLKYGAPDWYAEVNSRMNGWRVETTSHLKVLHHRPTGDVSGRLRYMYRGGRAAFSLGSDPLFELGRSAARIQDRPFMLAALARLAGFAVGYCVHDKRLVSQQFVHFLRSEQKQRLLLACRSNGRGLERLRMSLSSRSNSRAV